MLALVDLVRMITIQLLPLSRVFTWQIIESLFDLIFWAITRKFFFSFPALVRLHTRSDDDAERRNCGRKNE